MIYISYDIHLQVSTRDKTAPQTAPSPHSSSWIVNEKSNKRPNVFVNATHIEEDPYTNPTELPLDGGICRYLAE